MVIGLGMNSGTQQQNKNSIWNKLCIHIGLIVIYLLSFWMITESGYRCDDCYNANIIGATYLTGQSLWDFTRQAVQGWLDSGRFFPFSSYTYLLFGVLSTRWSYKFAIVIATYVNSLLFGVLLKKTTHSEFLQYMFMILFPICIPLSCEYNSALYSYHLLMHVLLLWLTFSCLCVLQYADTGRWYWGLLGGITLFLALGTYEVAFTFIVLIMILVWNRTEEKAKFGRKLLRLLKDCSFHLAALVLAGLINVLLRLKTGGSSYDGISMHLDPGAILYGTAKQLSAGFPLARYYITVGRNQGIRDEIWILGHSIRWNQIVLLLLTAFLIWLVIRTCYKQTERNVTRGVCYRLLVFGAGLLFLPAAIIGLSEKYQAETQWGMGHLPAYIQSYGFTVIFLILMLLLYQAVRRLSLRRALMVLYGLVLAGVLVVNQYMGWNTVSGENQFYRYPRDCVEAAFACGILDQLDYSNGLLTSTGYVMDYLGPNLFYSKLMGHAVNAMNVNGQTEYQPTPSDCAIYTFADDSRGYCIAGQCTELEYTVDKDENPHTTIWITDCYLYLTGEYDTPGYTYGLSDQRGDALVFDIGLMDVVRQGDSGTLYHYVTEDPVDIQSFTVLQ